MLLNSNKNKFGTIYFENIAENEKQKSNTSVSLFPKFGTVAEPSIGAKSGVFCCLLQMTLNMFTFHPGKCCSNVGQGSQSRSELQTSAANQQL